MKTNTVHLLRLEAAAALMGSVAAYHYLNGSWPLFACLFLVPDLSMLGYLFNPRTGAWTYNTAHSYVVPAVLAAATFAWTAAFSPLWLVWFAHIAFDRLLGYGLKQDEGFGFTHLGTIGHTR